MMSRKTAFRSEVNFLEPVGLAPAPLAKAWLSIRPHWYMIVGSRPKEPMRQRASIPIVYRSSWYEGLPAAGGPTGGAIDVPLPRTPPTVRMLTRLRRALIFVTPSAWNQEKRGFRSSPLMGEYSGLTISE